MLASAPYAARWLAAAAMVTTMMVPAHAQIVSRETDIAGLRLGQRVLVDDGSCSAGQIKQVTGIKLVGAAVQRKSQCVDRKNAKR